jgi:hypothetical protein
MNTRRGLKKKLDWLLYAVIALWVIGVAAALILPWYIL